MNTPVTRIEQNIIKRFFTAPNYPIFIRAHINLYPRLILPQNKHHCNKCASMLTYCNADVFRSRPHRKQGNVGANPTIGLEQQVSIIQIITPTERNCTVSDLTHKLSVSPVCYHVSVCANHSLSTPLPVLLHPTSIRTSSGLMILYHNY